MHFPSKTKNLVGKKWGLNPARALWIFEAIVRPKLTYRCLVSSHSLNQTNNYLLNRIQRLGLMGASHSLRSSPLAALQTILGILPICLHISALAETAQFRTRPLLWDRWDGVEDRKENGHMRLLDDRLNQHCLIQLPTDVGSKKTMECRMTASSILGYKYLWMPLKEATTPASPFWPVGGM